MDFKRAGTIAWRRGDLDEAARCFDAAICDDVQDWESIAALASICLDQGKLGQAYALYANAARIDPTNAAILADIGRVLIAWGEYEDALPIFERAHRIDPHNLAAINNAAMACINLGRSDDAARWLQAGRDIPLEHQFNADFSQVDRNWAFVHLMRQDWAKAWPAFDLGMGCGDRVERNYGSYLLPRWSPDMARSEKVVIYGEQGIGDELLFGSCIPDVFEHCDNVIIETMPRLVGVFSRSFPQATVYGTRYEDEPEWVAHEKPTSRSSMGQLPRWFRGREGDFPGTPYIRTNSVMRAAVKGILDPLPRRKKIGIAWSGGTVRTGWQERRVPIEELMRAFAGIDAEFVSLQHSLGDERPEDVGVHVFPMITHRALDYEWTAALLAELDLVVSVPTAVVHAAGAVGTPSLVMLNEHAQWRCGGPSMPWWSGCEVMRDWTLDGVAARIEEKLNGAV
jgi:hypothetical protein